MIGFETLRERLLDRIRNRIKNGETTERAFALRSGISQPHMHNLLKGVRGLNMEQSDRLLTSATINIFDLMEADELRHALFVRLSESEPWLEIPVLQGRLGPGLPLPEEPSRFERIRVPFSGIAGFQRPVVVRLSADAEMMPALEPGDLVALDRGRCDPAILGPDTLFAIECDGEGLLRWIRRGRLGYYLASAESKDRPRAWRHVPEDRRLKIRCRGMPLKWMRQPELLLDPLLRLHGKHLGPARLSDAS